MKKKKNSIEDEINAFINFWDVHSMTNLISDLVPIFELYDVDEEDDWVEQAVGEENQQNIRLIKTVYLISRLSEHHAEKLAVAKVKFPKLWRRMEKEIVEAQDE